MKTLYCISLLTLAPLGLVGQTASDIPPPQKRAVTLELARTFLTTKPIDISAEEVARKDPFNPRQQSPEINQPEKPVAVKTVGMADREILANIAKGVTPSGMMQLGDTPILLFGQKKLKVGDSIPIVFQGTTYEVYIGGIERTSFTLRLNKEEIIRPIKPVN